MYYMFLYTYIKLEKRSQIDFVFTNREGMKQVIDFSVVTENWHLSDHLPITVDMFVPESINCSSLLKSFHCLSMRLVVG